MKLNFRQKQARSYLSNKHLKINAYTFQSSANCLSYKFKAHNWLQIFILGQNPTLAIRWGTLGSHWVHWSRTKGLPNWWQLIASSGHKNRELECKPTVDVPPTLHVARFKECLRGWFAWFRHICPPRTSECHQIYHPTQDDVHLPSSSVIEGWTTSFFDVFWWAEQDSEERISDKCQLISLVSCKILDNIIFVTTVLPLMVFSPLFVAVWTFERWLQYISAQHLHAMYENQDYQASKGFDKYITEGDAGFCWCVEIVRTWETPLLHLWIKWCSCSRYLRSDTVHCNKVDKHWRLCLHKSNTFNHITSPRPQYILGSHRST